LLRDAWLPFAAQRFALDQIGLMSRWNNDRYAAQLRARRTRSNAMQVIFEYLSVGDLFGLVGVGIMIAAFAANCSYQKHRAQRQHRVAPKAARPAAQATPARNVAAHA
jgi:hypothetical protein